MKYSIHQGYVVGPKNYTHLFCKKQLCDIIRSQGLQHFYTVIPHFQTQKCQHSECITGTDRENWIKDTEIWMHHIMLNVKVVDVDWASVASTSRVLGVMSDCTATTEQLLNVECQLGSSELRKLVGMR